MKQGHERAARRATWTLRIALATLMGLAAPAVGGGRLSASPRPALTWSSLSPPASPAGLVGAVAANDGATVVLFGGRFADGRLSGETWLWDGSTWSKAAPFGASPPPRQLASMAFDTALSPPQLILFGGRGADGTLLDDTWTWNGSSWNQLATTSSPGGRDGAAMTTDAAGQLVLFGGYGLSTPTPVPPPTTTTTTTLPPTTTTTTTLPPTTTTLPPTTTTTVPTTTSTSSPGTATTLPPAVTTTTTPPAQGPSTATTVPVPAARPSGAPQVIGTETVTTPQVLDDTWVLQRSSDGTDDWQQVTGAVRPPAATEASLAGGPAGQVVLFGGTGRQPGGHQAAGATGQTWLFDGSTWSEVKVGRGPAPRQDASLAYDADLGATVLFGGLGVGGPKNDTWMWNGSSWARTTPASAPSPRSGAAAAYDQSSRQLVTFGGADGGGVALSSTEVLSTQAPTLLPAPGSTTSVAGAPAPTSAPQATTTTTIGDGSAFAPSSTSPPVSVTHQSSRAPTAVSVHRGEVMVLTGSGFLPHAEITVTFHSVATTVAVKQADANGSFTLNVLVPTAAALGHHHFEASGRGPYGMTNLSTPVQVVAFSAEHSSTTTITLVAIAVALPLLSWAALDVAGRRRRRPAHR